MTLFSVFLILMSSCMTISFKNSNIRVADCRVQYCPSPAILVLSFGSSCIFWTTRKVEYMSHVKALSIMRCTSSSLAMRKQKHISPLLKPLHVWSKTMAYRELCPVLSISFQSYTPKWMSHCVLSLKYRHVLCTWRHVKDVPSKTTAEHVPLLCLRSLGDRCTLNMHAISLIERNCTHQ